MLQASRRVIPMLAVVLAMTAAAVEAAPSSAKATEDRPAVSDGRLLEDWQLQDSVTSDKDYPKAIATILKELGDDAKLRGEYEKLHRGKIATKDARWGKLYVEACQQRRLHRLAPYLKQIRRVIFTKHKDLGGSHYAYTEALSDGQGECHWLPGTALCVLEMDDAGKGTVRTLLDDPAGMIRDPDVSYDGKRVLFARKKDRSKDDFHLYEMTVADEKIRQITDGLGYADYEGAYLPSGDIVFNSSRCVQTVDCFHPTVSNLYTCDKDGKYLRRLSFDQVHTNYPAVTPDGRVIYTRWDYSDRGQIYPQGLFQMYPDGTGQTDLYGNNSYFPTTILHARGIPGTTKIVAVFSGHHTRQRGKLGILDPSRGRQEAEGAQLIAPVRETKAVKVDRYGQDSDQFQYPWALDEKTFLVTYKPDKSKRNFAVYFMDADGRRELLACDDKISCNQSIPLAAREKPGVMASPVDYRANMGVYYLQDIYEGPGLAGIPRGTIKSLRVVEITYRPVDIGRNTNRGPAGGAMSSTPISIGGGAWDPKVIHGSAKVHEDGSACFIVPARTPVYFQAIDANGEAVQTMRSWSTLQPGEAFSCVGCHESKNTAPPVRRISTAMRAGPQQLTPFYGPARGFSFRREIQPILDKHCIRCHDDRKGVAGPPLVATASHAHAKDAVDALHDRKDPTSSADLKTPRFTWWDRKGGGQWVRYDFNKVRKVSAVEVYWFDDEAIKGLCRVPKAWEVHFQDASGRKWGKVTPTSEYGVAKDRFNRVTFKPVEATALRIKVALQKNYSGGILEWKTDPPLPQPKPSLETPGKKKAFSLLGEPNVDSAARRTWSDAYLALTGVQGTRSKGSLSGKQNKMVNWVNVQEGPPMLPPYHAGAAKSGILPMLRKGHNEVKLSREELDKIACWIDLLVPYCADYVEANTWSEKEMKVHDYFLGKRTKAAQEEAANIAELLKKK
jgi:hypothetical protein